ncbi:MAG: hypothetical protein P8016_09620 [Sedimentisphaerales bacterium]
MDCLFSVALNSGVESHTTKDEEIHVTDARTEACAAPAHGIGWNQPLSSEKR